jgi:predicted ATP-grasp superfamily ATP-dependent carboligase
MVVGFEGWNDAGEAASLAVDHLARVWSAEPLATIDPEEFYDFTVARPEIALEDGGARRLVWPAPEVLVAPVPGSDRRLVLLRGIEPHMRWRAFCKAVADMTESMEVDEVVLLGALLADVPHSRPPRVSGASGNPALTAHLDLSSSPYEGPTGIIGILYDSLCACGVPVTSLWASVPHYAHQLPSPKAVLALLQRVSVLLGAMIEPRELIDAAAEYEAEVDEQISDDPETVAYVAELEEADDAEGHARPGAEDLAREIERYLREHRLGG